MEIYSNKPSFQQWPNCTCMIDWIPMVYTHYIQQWDKELKKMAAMRAHNIGFYKPSHWHTCCQVISFCWCGFSRLDVHFELSIITFKAQRKGNRTSRYWDASRRGRLMNQYVERWIMNMLLSFTSCRLAIVVVDVVVGFILLVLSQNI